MLIAGIVTGVTLLGMRTYHSEQAYQALVEEVEAYQDIYLPNLYADDIHLGGMTAQEGIDAVVQQSDARHNAWRLNLTYQGTVI